MGRSPCCSKEGLNRGAWTAQEDNILREYVKVHGEGKWRNLPQSAGLKRCGKSCRLRWLNYLRPDIKRGDISPDEEELIIRLHKLLGNRWSLIAGRLPGRTDNEIKNYWNTTLSKKFKPKMNHSTSKVIPSPSSSPNLKSHVVRTKASKCSKLLFIDPIIFPHSSMKLQSKTEPEQRAEAEPLVVDDGANNLTNNSDNKMESDGFDDEKEPPFDLLLDFDIGDICLPDLLNSDFASICNNFGDDYDRDCVFPLSN